MTKQVKTKYQPHHWRIEPASREFGCDGETLSKALKRASIEPAFKDGSFSTAQIVAALFGDYDAQRTRKITAEADLLEMQRAEKKHELVPGSEFLELMHRGHQAMTSTVMGMTDMTIENREKIIEQIREAGASVVGRVGNDKATTPVQS